MRATCFGLLLAAAVGVAAEWPPGQFELTVRDGEYVLEAREAPVNDILADLSRKTGIPIRTDPADRRRVTVTVRKRDLEAFVNAVAAGSVVTYVQDPRSGEYVIEEIRTSRAEDPAVKRRQWAELERLRQAGEWTPPPELRHPVRYSGIGAGLVLAPGGQGVLIYPLSPDSPAARAGLQKGAYVTAVNGRPVGEFHGLAEITQAIRGPAGTTVELRVRRGYGAEVPVVIRREVFEYKPPGR